jgi:hypothetical protein
MALGKVRVVAQDPLTKEWRQVTRRGFATALDASQARRDALDPDVPVSVDVETMTVNQLIERYFRRRRDAGMLSAKSLHHYRDYLNFYIAPYLGDRSVREVTPEMLATWQQRLATGGSKTKGPLSPNSIRLARAPLAGTFKYAVRLGYVRRSPMDNVPRPQQQQQRRWALVPRRGADVPDVAAGGPAVPVVGVPARLRVAHQ